MVLHEFIGFQETAKENSSHQVFPKEEYVRYTGAVHIILVLALPAKQHSILHAANCPDNEKSDVLRRAEEHLRIVQVERSFYKTTCDD